MAKSSNQKLKLVYLMEILEQHTDEEHPISMNDILNKLASYDISAERKSIYNDIDELKKYGMDIIFKKEAPSGYYLGQRFFELPELKLLVDIVQSSKFITMKKSNELIKKIEHLSSVYDAKHLQRQVFVANRIKTMNESIYYNIDGIHNAILSNCQIQFLYYEWTINKEMKYKKEGEYYHISPWALTWADDNYYMIGYDHLAGKVKHYRVDKMTKISCTEEKRLGQKEFTDFDLGIFDKKTFGMFSGEEETVCIEFDNSLIGVVLDRFGKDIMIRESEKSNTFRIRVDIIVSDPFFGWVAGFGNNIRLISPLPVVEKYKEHIEKILSKY